MKSSGYFLNGATSKTVNFIWALFLSVKMGPNS